MYGSGCPSFGFSASFNCRKVAVEITMRQECAGYKAMESNGHIEGAFQASAVLPGWRSDPIFIESYTDHADRFER